jgi:hypothetical protein
VLLCRRSLVVEVPQLVVVIFCRPSNFGEMCGHVKHIT